MARGRVISSAITSDKKINRLSDDTCRLVFTWLLTFADVEGRTYGDPALVKSLLFPRRHDITIEQVEGYLQELHNAELIVWYEANDDFYVAFPNFEKHQPWLRKDREAPSIIPPPPIKQAKSGTTPDVSSPKAESSTDITPELLRQNDGVTPEDWRHKSGLIEINRDQIKREEKNRTAAAVPAFSEQIDPIKILADASNLATFPPDQMGWIEVVIRLAENFGVDKTVDAMKRACTRWVNTTGKNKRNYRRTNLAWINIAQDELAGGNEIKKKPSEMSDREYLAYISQLSEVQNA